MWQALLPRAPELPNVFHSTAGTGLHQSEEGLEQAGPDQRSNPSTRGTPRMRRPEPTGGRPRVTDPVLTRALDLLKSLAILETRGL
jgi:hypothetical protein